MSYPLAGVHSLQTDRQTDDEQLLMPIIRPLLLSSSSIKMMLSCYYTSPFNYVLHHGHRFVKLYVSPIYVLFIILYPLPWLSSLISPFSYETVHHFCWQPFAAHP